jgi:hypothetical protein
MSGSRGGRIAPQKNLTGAGIAQLVDIAASAGIRE